MDDARFLLPDVGATVVRGWQPLAIARLRRAGLHVRRHRVFGRLVVPVGRGRSARMAPRPSRWARPERLAIASTSGGPPRLVAAAASLGVDVSGTWYLVFGEDHPRSRSAFFVFAPGSAVPTWVVKFGRIPEAVDRFDAEERGMTVAAVMGHAPRLIGRFVDDGLPASVETAASGVPLAAHLRGRASTASKLATVDAVASWLVQVAAAARGTAPPHRELDYLAEEVVPRWTARGAPADLLARVSTLPAVPTHGDLAPTNVVVDRTSFTAVDWEDAQLDGLALSDLVDFLVGALGLLDDPERVLLGASEHSPVLIRWLSAAADALDIDSATVDALVTMRLLEVATSWRRYAERDLGIAADAVLPEEQRAAAWLAARGR